MINVYAHNKKTSNTQNKLIELTGERKKIDSKNWRFQHSSVNNWWNK